MNLEDIYEKYKNIKYGYYDKNNNRMYHINDGFLRKFRLQSVESIENTRVGICWETVELLRYNLEKENYNCKSYLFVSPQDQFYNHSLVVCEYNKKYYWIEISLEKLNGIREYDSLKDLFFDLLDNFDIVMPNNDIDYKKIKIYEYEKPRSGSNCLQFIYHCFSGKNITKDYIPIYLKNIAQKSNK